MIGGILDGWEGDDSGDVGLRDEFFVADGIFSADDFSLRCVTSFLIPGAVEKQSLRRPHSPQ
jgi:hypothetical protein